MATRKLSLPQSIAVVLYILFFAVQLHYRYVDIRIAGSDKYFSFATQPLDSKHKTLSKHSASDLQSNFNVKLNKRFFPSDYFLLSVMTLNSQSATVSLGSENYHHTENLLTQIGPAGSDRGPPSFRLTA